MRERVAPPFEGPRRTRFFERERRVSCSRSWTTRRRRQAPHHLLDHALGVDILPPLAVHASLVNRCPNRRPRSAEPSVFEVLHFDVGVPSDPRPVRPQSDRHRTPDQDSDHGSLPRILARLDAPERQLDPVRPRRGGMLARASEEGARRSGKVACRRIDGHATLTVKIRALRQAE